MTEQDAKAYLRFEAELMAHLLRRMKERREFAEGAGAPADTVFTASAAYIAAIADVAEFGGSVTERFIARKTG